MLSDKAVPRMIPSQSTAVAAKMPLADKSREVAVRAVNAIAFYPKFPLRARPTIDSRSVSTFDATTSPRNLVWP
jgi:uncharacterized protein (UPF0147 family)